MESNKSHTESNKSHTVLDCGAYLLSPIIVWVAQTNQSTWYLKPRQNHLSEGSVCSVPQMVIISYTPEEPIPSNHLPTPPPPKPAILEETRTFIQESYKVLVAQGTKGRVYFLFLAFQRPPNGAVLGLGGDPMVMEHRPHMLVVILGSFSGVAVSQEGWVWFP